MPPEEDAPGGAWRWRGRLRNGLYLAGFLLAEPRWEWLAAGGALLLPGMALHLRARGCLHLSGERLSTSGPYARTRNPFYLASLLLDAGIALSTGRPLLLAAYLPLWFLVYGSTIRREEGLLAAKFGADYRAYRAAVPRLWPRLRPAAGLPASPGFLWSNPTLAEGLEAARQVSYLSAPLVIWAGNDLLRRFVAGEPALPPGLGPVALYAAAAGGKAAEGLLRLRTWRWKRRAAPR